MSPRVVLFNLIVIIALTGCSEVTSIGEGVIAPERVRLRQSTGRVPGDAGELRRGDRVTILGEQGDFLKVRGESSSRIEGWLDKRDVVSQQVIARAQELANTVKGIPAQAAGKLRQDSRLRLTPARDNEENVVFLVPRETTFEILDRKRTAAPKEGMETWYQVRLPKDFVAQVGWIYGGSVELSVPPEIATFENSGLRFIAWQAVGRVRDSQGEEMNNYVTLQKHASNNEPGVDFDRIYALAWDPGAQGYYSMFVQSGVRGRLPLRVEKGSDGKSVVSLTLLGKNDEPEVAEFTVATDEKGRYYMRRVTAPQSGSRRQ